MVKRNHIVMYSGGISSFAAAAWLKDNVPADENIVLYFQDTLWESPDLYRFLYESADKLGLPLLIHSKGLTPIQLMFEEKVIFNSRIGLCSKKLKAEVAMDYLKKGIVPKIEKWHNLHLLKDSNYFSNMNVIFGIDFNEFHRVPAISNNWNNEQITAKFPLVDHVINKEEYLKKYKLRAPHLYSLGFPHNNCNARCIKAGLTHYGHLLEVMPEVFNEFAEQEHYLKLFVSAYHAIKKMESDGRDGLDDEVKAIWFKELDDAYRGYFYGEKKKPDLFIHPSASASCEYSKMQQYSVLKKTVDKEAGPYPLLQFKRDAIAMKKRSGQQIDLFDNDWGGCGCSVDYGAKII